MTAVSDEFDPPAYQRRGNDYALLALTERLGQIGERTQQMEKALHQQSLQRGEELQETTKVLRQLTEAVSDLQRTMQKVPEVEHSGHHEFIRGLVDKQKAQAKFWNELIGDLKKNAFKLFVKGLVILIGLMAWSSIAENTFAGIARAAGKALGLPL